MNGIHCLSVRTARRCAVGLAFLIHSVPAFAAGGNEPVKAHAMGPFTGLLVALLLAPTVCLFLRRRTPSRFD